MTPTRIVIGSARRESQRQFTARTLADAFGPYAQLTVTDRRRAGHADRMIGAACVVILVGVVAGLLIESLA